MPRPALTDRPRQAQQRCRSVRAQRTPSAAPHSFRRRPPPRARREAGGREGTPQRLSSAAGREVAPPPSPPRRWLRREEETEEGSGREGPAQGRTTCRGSTYSPLLPAGPCPALPCPAPRCPPGTMLSSQQTVGLRSAAGSLPRGSQSR